MTENDIEAAANAAAEAEAEKPAEEREDAPPAAPEPAPEPEPEAKKPAKKKAGKASQGRKEAEAKGAVQRTLKKAHANKVEATTGATSENQARIEALAKATAERQAAVGKLCDKLRSLHGGDDAEAYAECLAELRATAMPGDAGEAAAQVHAEADELEAQALELRKLYADLLVRGPADDGATHAQRLKAVQARSVEIREQRKKDRLALMAASAGRSKLDQAMAERPRQPVVEDPADAAQE
jgi:hypothetical protein